MSNRQNFPQREKNILDGTNLSISAPCPTADGKWSSLKFLVVNGNPRLLVYTNDPNDAGNNHGRIVVQMTPLVFATFLNIWEACLDQPTGYRQVIECENFTFFGGKRSERPELLNKIIVGKDADGVVSIMVLDNINDSRPRIKFEIKAPRFVKIVGGDGQPMLKADESVLFSKTWLDTLRPISAALMTSTWKEPKRAQNNQGGQRQGGYGGGQGGGGGNQGNQNNQGNSNNDFGDDLPF